MKHLLFALLLTSSLFGISQNTTDKDATDFKLLMLQNKINSDSIASLRNELDNINFRFEEAGWKFQTAGNLGAYGISISVLGGALALAGAIVHAKSANPAQLSTPVKTLLGLGAGFTGVGVTFGIISFARIHRSGKILRKID